MSYSVYYNPELRKKYPKHNVRKQFPVKQVAVIVVILLAVYILAQSGSVKLLLPGNSDVTASALSTLTEKISSGESIKDAVYCFCEEIINNGK